MKFTEDQLAAIAKKVAERVKKLQGDGKNTLTDAAIRAMVDEQMKLAEQSRKSQFNQSNQSTPVVPLGVGGINSAKAKMIMSKSVLGRYHNPDIVSKILEFQKLQDDVYIVGNILAAQGQNYIDAVKSTNIYRVLQSRLQSDQDLAKALDTAASGGGAEWIPTGFSNDLMEAVRLQLKISPLFRSIDMPTNPYTHPVQTGKSTGYLVAQSTDATGTKPPEGDPATGNFTLDAVKLATRVITSEELNEDSIIAIIDFIRGEIAKALAEAEEDAVLNGDTTATHQDSDVTAGTDRRKAWKGLRKKALANAGTATLDFAGGISITNIRSMRKLMGVHGVKPSDLAHIVSLNGYIQCLGMTEVLTRDKWGDGYTAKSGELAVVDGSPLLVSEFMRDDLNASGVHDGVTETKTGMLTVWTPGFVIGNRKNITVRSEVDIETDQVILVAKTRKDFKDPYNAELAANVQSVYGYNITK